MTEAVQVHHLATDGRFPGKRGLATRQKLLDSTAGLLATTPWRSIRVIDIAKSAGTSPATFYQYFENVEKAMLVLADELVEGAGELAGLVDGDWSEPAGWETACNIVDGFMGYWERNRAVFRVVDLATAEGDLRFQSQRVHALNAVTESFARVIALTRSGNRVPVTSADVSGANASGADASGADSSGDDPMAIAATLVSMLAHVAAHRYGYEFWGIRTASMSDVEARVVYWAVTGRSVG